MTTKAGDNAVEKADVAVGERIASKREQPWAKVLAKVGTYGDQEPLYTASAAVLTIGLLQRDRRLAQVGAAMIAAVATADAIKSLLKRSVSRSRPKELLDNDRYEAEVGEEPDDKDDQSFPSGHVACTLSAALALGHAYPKAKPAALGVAGVVAASRLVKGEHWPLDVAAGALIGIVAEAISGRLLRRVIGIFAD